MSYIFPAIFEKNADRSYTITFPDLPGCISEGKDLNNALEMSQDALSQWLSYLIEEERDIPEPQEPTTIKTTENQFVNLVKAKKLNTKAVRRTVSIPAWMDKSASEAGLSLSKILQDALKEKISNF